MCRIIATDVEEPFVSVCNCHVLKAVKSTKAKMAVPTTDL